MREQYYDISQNYEKRNNFVIISTFYLRILAFFNNNYDFISNNLDRNQLFADLWETFF